MAVGKPTLLRWTEEAEAKHVREWAVLEYATRDGTLRLCQCAPTPRGSTRWPAQLFCGLRTFFRSASDPNREKPQSATRNRQIRPVLRSYPIDFVSVHCL